MLSTEEFLAQAEAQGFGVTYRTLRYYAAQGLVPPPEISRDAQGHPHGLYAEESLANLALISALQGHGFALKQIKETMDDLAAEAGVESPLAFTAYAALAGELRAGKQPPGALALSQRFGKSLTDLVDRLADGEEPVSVAVTVANSSGVSQTRYVFLAPAAFAVNQLQFWQMNSFVAFYNSVEDAPYRPLTPASARDWLHQRPEWGTERVYLVQHENQIAGMGAMHVPWTAALTGQSEMFGPLVKTDYAGLGIETTLTETIRQGASREGFTALSGFMDEPGGTPAGRWILPTGETSAPDDWRINPLRPTADAQTIRRICSVCGYENPDTDRLSAYRGLQLFGVTFGGLEGLLGLNTTDKTLRFLTASFDTITFGLLRTGLGLAAHLKCDRVEVLLPGALEPKARELQGRLLKSGNYASSPIMQTSGSR